MGTGSFSAARDFKQALVIWVKKQALVLSLEELPQGQGQSKGSVGTGELALCTLFLRDCRRGLGRVQVQSNADMVMGE